MDAWWECDVCDAWVDFLGPLLVDEAEWHRRREIRHERKALLVLTGLALGVLFALALATVPQAVHVASVYALSTLRAALCLLFGFYAPLVLLAIFVGTLTN